MVSLTSAPTSEYDSPQGEADGHAYVQLTGPGQSVQWTNNTASQSTSSTCAPPFPTRAAGGGMHGHPGPVRERHSSGQALNMNSIQSWQYEGNNNYNGSDQNPADGDPRDFWDEFHGLSSAARRSPAGATFGLQRDSTNSASFY